jgi:hypothetical protein
LPDKIDPAAGITLKYFTGKDGFARPMAPIEGEGVVWLYGVAVLADGSGRERMLAYFQRRRGLGAVLENGFVVYNDAKEVFEKLKTVLLDPPIFPHAYFSRVKRDETDLPLFQQAVSDLARKSRLEVLPGPILV